TRRSCARATSATAPRSRWRRSPACWSSAWSSCASSGAGDEARLCARARLLPRPARLAGAHFALARAGADAPAAARAHPGELRAAGLRDSLAGLVLPYATFALPLTLWLLTSYFRELPDELYRAARVDGCTPWQAFVHVFLPLSWPALATCAILVFIFSWNELL